MVLGLAAIVLLFWTPWVVVGTVLSFLVLLAAASLGVFIPLKEIRKQ
jgi:hypothetical protein